MSKLHSTLCSIIIYIHVLFIQVCRAISGILFSFRHAPFICVFPFILVILFSLTRMTLDQDIHAFV